MKVIDCRNLACPAPVVKTRQTLELAGDETFCILLDHGAPEENVTRFVLGRGCDVHAEEQADGVALTVTPPKNKTSLTGYPANSRSSVILISSDRLGNGPDELGRLLMKNFIITLLELDALPSALFFVNSGVLITTEGSELLEPLLKLAACGVEIYSCGVCLDYFGLRDKLAAGGITNMFTIVETLHKGANVISI
jgi:selenium metabolism protein YedF